MGEGWSRWGSVHRRSFTFASGGAKKFFFTRTRSHYDARARARTNTHTHSALRMMAQVIGLDDARSDGELAGFAELVPGVSRSSSAVGRITTGSGSTSCLVLAEVMGCFKKRRISICRLHSLTSGYNCNCYANNETTEIDTERETVADGNSGQRHYVT